MSRTRLSLLASSPPPPSAMTSQRSTSMKLRICRHFNSLGATVDSILTSPFALPLLLALAHLPQSARDLGLSSASAPR